MGFQKGDVVQFTEEHKWCGCFGFINEVKDCGDDIRFLIGVPIPQQGTAFIFSMWSKNEFEYVGKAVLLPVGEEEDEEEGD